MSRWRGSTAPWHVPVLFWICGLTLAALQTWAAIRAESMNADGVAYLDIADAYRAGSWTDAINAVWSPLYSWVLAGAMQVAGDRASEIVMVHVTNFSIFVFAFLAFTLLHRELRRTLHDTGLSDRRPLPLWAWDAAAYLVFLYAALTLITIWAVTPDMLMAGFLCLASAMIVRIRSDRAGVLDFAILGLALGLAYLAKSVMFPLGIVFLGAALLSARVRPAGWRPVLLSVAVFLALSAPWITAISRAQGRLTFGDAGRITYLRYVNQIPYPYWHGESPELGSPAHPARLVLENPPIHEFSDPGFGTNPLSFDPAYWYEGAKATFQPGRQARALLQSMLFYYDLFIRDLGAAFLCVLLLYLFAVRGRPRMSPDWRRLTLLLPSAVALGLYAMVYVEGRYVGVFVLLIGLDVLTCLRLPQAMPRRLLTIASGALVACLGAALVVFHLRGSIALQQNPVASASTLPGQASPHAIAASLRAMGVEPGDPVGVIGYVFDAFWARAAGVRLVAELRPDAAADLWRSDKGMDERVLRAFEAAGAKAIVAEYVPPREHVPGWQQVGTTSSYVRLVACASTVECYGQDSHSHGSTKGSHGS